MDTIKDILVMTYGWSILTVVGLIIYLDIRYKRVVKLEGYGVGIFILVTVQKLAALLLVIASIHYVMILESYMTVFIMWLIFAGYKFFDDAHIGKIVIREGLLDEEEDEE